MVMTEEFFCIYFWNLLAFGIFLGALYSVLSSAVVVLAEN